MNAIGSYAGFSPTVSMFGGGQGSLLAGARLSAGKGASEAFAREAVRRATDFESGPRSGTATGADGSREGSSRRLESALADVMESMRSELGDGAASTAQAIIMRRLSASGAGENALGSALTASLEFVDRTFGTSVGDRFISRFNGELNDAINEHFENGASERFMVAGGAGVDLAPTVSLFAAGIAERFGPKAAGEAKSIIEEVLAEDGESYTSARKGFGKALDHLEEAYGADAGEARSILDQAFAAFLGQSDGYGPGAPALAGRGQALDLSV